MKNKTIASILMTIALVLAVTGIVWITVLKIDHFDTVFTMRLNLIVFWKPSVLILLSIPFYIAGKIYRFKK